MDNPSTRNSSTSRKKKISDLVRQFLDPFYENKIIGSKDLFKTLVQEFTHAILATWKVMRTSTQELTRPSS
jgi:hypothetical protein